MSFNTNLPYVEYVINTNQTLFVFNFKAYFNQDVTVYLTQQQNQRRLRENTDYTVNLLGDTGGDITLTTSTNKGDLLVIRRELDLNRLVEYQTSGDLLAKTLNDDQEYQTYLIQDLNGASKNYLQVPKGVPNFDASFPGPGNGEFITWDNNKLTTKALPKCLKGDKGDKGPQGLQGPQGPQGNTGSTGPQGHAGIKGPQGLQGQKGSQGSQGPQGQKGDQGTGVTIIGSDTLTNIQAKTGAAGDMWLDTATGHGHVSNGQGAGAANWTDVGPIRGPKGSTGLQGAKGDTGTKGDQGIIGPKGSTGPQGQTGPTGPQGIVGADGPRGYTGPKGQDAAVYSYDAGTKTLTITLP